MQFSQHHQLNRLFPIYASFVMNSGAQLCQVFPGSILSACLAVSTPAPVFVTLALQCNLRSGTETPQTMVLLLRIALAIPVTRILIFLIFLKPRGCISLNQVYWPIQSLASGGIIWLHFNSVIALVFQLQHAVRSSSQPLQQRKRATSECLLCTNQSLFFLFCHSPGEAFHHSLQLRGARN